MKINQKGFGTVEALLILVIVAVIGGTGWFVYHATQSSDKNAQQTTTTTTTKKTIASFSDCVNAGNKATDTTPKTCVANGNTYTEFTASNPQTTQATSVKFSSVDAGLQQAITASFTKNDPNCKIGTVDDGKTSVDKDRIIQHYSSKQAAIVGVGCGSGTAHLFGYENNAWADVETTQLAFSCTALKKYHVPSSWIDSGNCTTGTELTKYQ